MNGLIRFWDNGPYSHAELVLSSGTALSVSYDDGRRVRAKQINFNPDHWDFVEVPADLEMQVMNFFVRTEGKPYDLWGQVRFLFLAPHKGSSEGYWCTEWIAAALGMVDPWRYSPNILYSAVKFHYK